MNQKVREFVEFENYFYKFLKKQPVKVQKKTFKNLHPDLTKRYSNTGLAIILCMKISVLQTALNTFLPEIEGFFSIPD